MICFRCLIFEWMYDLPVPLGGRLAVCVCVSSSGNKLCQARGLFYIRSLRRAFAACLVFIVTNASDEMWSIYFPRVTLEVVQNQSNV